MAYEGNHLAYGNMNSELQQMIEQGGLYENIDPLEATNLPTDYPLGESFFANTHPNIASWQTALNVDATFTRLFVITRIDKNRLHAFQDIIVASGTETKRFTRYNLNDVWLDARESGGGGGEWNGEGLHMYSPYHGVYRFNNLNPWTLTNLPETIVFEFGDVPKTAFNGRFIMRVFMKPTATEPGGYLEHQVTVYDNPTHATAVNNVEIGQLYLSPSMVDMFYSGGGMSPRPVTGRQAWLLVKIAQQREVSVEIEYIGKEPNAEYILKDLDPKHDTTIYPNPWTAARQYSLFDNIKSSLQVTNGGLYYVNPTTGDNRFGVMGNINKPFRTIQGVLQLIPKYLNSNVVIDLAPGVYNEAIHLSGFTGTGTLTVRCTNFGAASLHAINLVDCTVRIDFQGLAVNHTSYTGVQVHNCSNVRVMNCTIGGSSPLIPYAGVNADNSTVLVYNTEIKYRGVALEAIRFGDILSENNTGANNNRALSASLGGIIVKNFTQPTGTASDTATTGGEIKG